MFLQGSHNLKAAKVANVAGSLFGEASDDEYDGRLPGERNRLLGKEDAEVSTLLRRSEEKGRSDDGSSSDGCEESSIDEDGDSDEGSSSDERGRRDEDSDGEGSA